MKFEGKTTLPYSVQRSRIGFRGGNCSVLGTFARRASPGDDDFLEFPSGHVSGFQI